MTPTGGGNERVKGVKGVCILYLFIYVLLIDKIKININSPFRYFTLLPPLWEKNTKTENTSILKGKDLL